MGLGEVVHLAAEAAAVIGAVVAIVVAVAARKGSKASAADAERSRAVAQESRDAQVRMADAIEKLVDGGPSPESSGPDVEFLIERRQGDRVALRNVGSGRATGVTIPEDQGGIHRNLPSGATLEPFQSHEFLIIGTLQSSAPAELKVISDQTPDGVFVRVPSKL